jgi:anaerobic ribonucleoside-triphosphate reductase
MRNKLSKGVTNMNNIKKIFCEKRSGEIVPYEKNKIQKAIQKANGQIDYAIQLTDHQVDELVEMTDNALDTECPSVEQIQEAVINAIIKKGYTELAKIYIVYRHDHNKIRDISNGVKESILTLVNGSNKDVMEENSNKNATIASTQRDLIAGEVSKDFAKRDLLPKKIVEAHENAVLHFHDMDYFLQPIFNCCLLNISDMLDNGTVINGKMIESPKSFQVACTVMTQIIAAVASGEYGGQSVKISHLAKYLANDYKKSLKKVREADGTLTAEQVEKIAKAETQEHLKSGIQTIQYQINTLMTTNGQTPFVTLFLQLDESLGYMDEQAAVIEEILKQRIVGMKNEAGVYVTPPFPKLIYVLDECNCLKGGKYDWLTKLAVKCSAKRMYPDYISAKKMRENYEGEVFSCMGCRSFLSPWKDENGNYKWEGRFNQGVVSLNLPQIGILSQSENGPDMYKFWQLMEERTSLCFEALMCRHKALLGTKSDISPIHWQYGGIARLKKGEVIDPLLKDGYSTISLGYIGLYEVTKLMTGKSHTTKEGEEFALKVMRYLKNKCNMWKDMTGIGFGLYGTPAESLCYRFARIDKEKFGEIKDITDKGYYTNSYHVDVREKINAFDKLSFESQFQQISSGGAISYIEIPNMENNLEVLEKVVKFIYENIQYAEFNTKSDYCMNCGFDGEIILNDENEWECPQCGNKDHSKMSVTRRTCGYLGSQFWNKGKTLEIKQRVVHFDIPVVENGGN